MLLVVWTLVLVLISSTMLGDTEPDAAGLHEMPGPGGKGGGGHRGTHSVREWRRSGAQRCHRNGTCLCDRGYEGEFCEAAICEQPCVHGVCLRPGYCTCEREWRGRNCDEPICKRACAHGKCTNPNFCQCKDGWFGRHCEKQCFHGHFSVAEQKCHCEAGWVGRERNAALCERVGCENGLCVQPDVCECHAGWTGESCTNDFFAEKVSDLMDGLSARQRKQKSLIVHKDDSFEQTWRYIRKWTQNLPEQWKFGRTRFSEDLPTNDTIAGYMGHRFKTCAAVGNSGGLLDEKAGAVIDAHQVVLRFNNAPTKGYEENVGSKTTFKLLNRKIIDILIEAKEGTDPSSKRRRGAPKRVMNLLWRAESYHQYSQLRKLYPDEFVYLITPEFLLPTMTFYKTLVQRMEKMGIKLPEQPAAPHGFIGVAFLRQICDTVTVYGFDPPFTHPKVKYHYFDRTEPLDPKSGELEHNILRILEAFEAIRLCTTKKLATCIQVDEAKFGMA